jgi:ABC-type dipeptide/oligopeptide/nickel transport system ATPase component
MIIKSEDKISIIGYSGSGKSTLMKHLINTLNFNFIIVDTVSLFSKKKPIRYKGVVECLNPRKNKRCIKIQDEDDLENIIKILNDKSNTKLFLVVDEIDQYTNTQHLLPETSLYFQQGRNYKHGGLFSVRQVGRLNKQILSNSHYLFLFKIFNKSDIEYLNQITGMPLTNYIVSLKPHEFYIIDLQISEILGKYILKGKQIVEI